MPLPRPLESQPHYGAHLGDAGYWSAYVREVLARHGLAAYGIEAPFVGTFPTFLCGPVVVKLFGQTFDGGRAFAVEQAMGELLAGEPDIPAPGILASGNLYGDGWPWPYLVTERAAGTAIREWEQVTEAVAGRLGAAVARLHTLPVPPAVAARNLLPELRCGAVERLRRWGLPEHLLRQVPDYLADASPQRVLAHADLTADHLFLDATGLRSIIDWGDALVADPWYELVAVRFDGLRADPALFAAFLEGYGWSDTADFARRSLQGILEFQFNAIDGISARIDLARVRTLDQLAGLLTG